MKPTERARIVAPIVLIALVAAGCGTQDVSDSQAAKAQELQAKLTSLGITVPEEIAASLYDEDGGSLCAAAEDDGKLDHVALVGHRFALRKTDVSPRDIAYGRAVIEVYCPEELAAYDDYVDGLRQGETSDD